MDKPGLQSTTDGATEGLSTETKVMLGDVNDDSGDADDDSIDTTGLGDADDDSIDR